MRLKVSVPFLGGVEEVNLPEENLLGIVFPKQVQLGDEAETIRKAVDNPIGSLSLRQFIENHKSFLIVVNDGTRPTPTAKVLEEITGFLRGKEVEVIVATGAHRAPTDEECREILGKYYKPLRGRIILHNSKNKEELVYLGETSRGTPVYLNKAVRDHDAIIIIGSVEPHYFAGYTGGRKGIVPGVAGYQTIERNHSLALQKGARLLALEGNPIHEDLTEAVSLLKDKTIFCINLVLDRNHRIYACTAGDLFDSLRAATEYAEEVFVVEIPQRADIVVCIVEPPLDINLYQAHKGIENARYSLKEQGIIILVSGCREGIGPSEFYDLLSKTSRPSQVYGIVERNYRLGYHKAVKLAEILEQNEIWAVTKLSRETLKKAFIRSLGSVQEAVNEALRAKGEDTKILFIMDAAITVPIPRDGVSLV
ncbi:MAG: nickel-dependent lactate racemase [Candidatus Bathyarchaeia archaeon]